MLILAGGYIGGNQAEANQPPPPPTYYTLTVNKSGGDSTCEVRIASPTSRSWTDTSDSASYVVGSEYEVEQQVNCPSSYRFSHWESNDDDLDGYTENHAPPVLTLTKNTTATAVFQQVPLPDAESTIWHDHYSLPPSIPHHGDIYWHQVSSSTDPTKNFSSLTMNEDFLTTEMDTSGCSMSLTQADKTQNQNNWDGDWRIDSNNYRREMDGEPADAKYDAHGFNPNVAPWNQMLSGEVFKVTQRMRVTGCPSVNNQGPWFAIHTIEFKVIYNSQIAQKEVFVKKSVVQGTGDPSF